MDSSTPSPQYVWIIGDERRKQQFLTICDAALKHCGLELGDEVMTFVREVRALQPMHLQAQGKGKPKSEPEPEKEEKETVTGRPKRKTFTRSAKRARRSVAENSPEEGDGDDDV